MESFIGNLEVGLTELSATETEQVQKEKYISCISECGRTKNRLKIINNIAFGYPVCHFEDSGIKCLNTQFEEIRSGNKNTKKFNEPVNKTNPLHISVIHSTNDMIYYIKDIYSEKGMYIIPDNVGDITVDNIETLIKTIGKSSQKPGNAGPYSVDDCSNIKFDSETNFSLKTILHIRKMFADRGNLKGYTFVKCIKATTEIKYDFMGSYSLSSVPNELKEYRSNPVKYSDNIVQDQLNDLGINLILSLEPKKIYTLFKVVASDPRYLDVITKLHLFIQNNYFNNENIFKEKYFVKRNGMLSDDKEKANGNLSYEKEKKKGKIFSFLSSPKEKKSDKYKVITFGDQEKNFDNLDNLKDLRKETVKVGDINYYNVKIYAQDITELTIKKFLENIFRLYDIIPTRKE
jgi:hypothetical protein